MAPAAAPTPVPINAPLPAPYPVPAPTAAPSSSREKILRVGRGKNYFTEALASPRPVGDSFSAATANAALRGRDMGQLDGKVALITGASKGIGRVMSRLFAQEGAAVVCAARSRDLVAETAALIKADGGRALAVTGDAATEADVQRMVEASVKAFGK